MSVTIKSTPVLVRPNGSHWLELNKHFGSELFGREELYPILEIEDVPRVGKVRAQFSVDRYVHSGGWSEWRIYLRDVRTPDPEQPDLPHLGREAANIGPATRAAISEACRPIIAAWLESAEYVDQRHRAATRAVVREVDAPRDYDIERARNTLSRAAEQLDPDTAGEIRAALDYLSTARKLLDAITA